MCLHNRQTTRDNFADKETEENLSANTSQHFALVCLRFLACGFRLSFFAICLPSKLMQQTLVFTCSLRIETLHTLLEISVDLLQGEREGLQKGGSHPVSAGRLYWGPGG